MTQEQELKELTYRIFRAHPHWPLEKAHWMAKRQMGMFDK